jgi:hypothetical protein
MVRFAPQGLVGWFGERMRRRPVAPTTSATQATAP